MDAVNAIISASKDTDKSALRVCLLRRCVHDHRNMFENREGAGKTSALCMQFVQLLV